jgi:hypothetical protein
MTTLNRLDEETKSMIALRSMLAYVSRELGAIDGAPKAAVTGVADALNALGDTLANRNADFDDEDMHAMRLG